MSWQSAAAQVPVGETLLESGSAQRAAIQPGGSGVAVKAGVAVGGLRVGAIVASVAVAGRAGAVGDGLSGGSGVASGAQAVSSARAGPSHRHAPKVNDPIAL